MIPFRAVLLEVWRATSQHESIQPLLCEIAPKIATQLPITAIFARELIASKKVIETVAAFVETSSDSFRETQASLSNADWKRIMSWARTHDWRSARNPPPQVAPLGEFGDLLAIPLLDCHAQSKSAQPDGVVVFVSPPGSQFNSTHDERAGELAEVFAAALANQRRHRQLATQRQSAEADRVSLLTRLGRKEMLESIVGADKGLRFVMERVELVAPNDAPVLILGETGSGKEVIARAIHERSPRNGGPFIRVNCGAIPSELIDSQLFGHEKGSFTGAADQRQGWFERADGGTLFLDEIGELPLPAQVRLLRVLQDHHFERVGGQQAVHVDVRIVAATHRDLAEMVAQKTFRQDLWYRINVFPLLLPRLSERQEDIPTLACHFARRAATRFGLSYAEPTAADLLLLSQYDWPGNVRELAAVIDRAAILGRGQALDVDAALGWSHHETNLVASTATSARPDAPRQGMDHVPIMSLDAAIAQHIERALAAAHGRIEGRQGAAELLAVNPHTLRAKMRKLGIDRNKFRG